MVVVGGQLLELLDVWCEGVGRGGVWDAEGVDCLGGGGVVFGVDADGVGEGEGGEGFEMWHEEGGDVGEEDGVALEDLREGFV